MNKDKLIKFFKNNFLHENQLENLFNELNKITFNSNDMTFDEDVLIIKNINDNEEKVNNILDIIEKIANMIFKDSILNTMAVINSETDNDYLEKMQKLLDLDVIQFKKDKIFSVNNGEISILLNSTLRHYNEIKDFLNEQENEMLLRNFLQAKNIYENFNIFEFFDYSILSKKDMKNENSGKRFSFLVYRNNAKRVMDFIINNHDSRNNMINNFLNSVDEGWEKINEKVKYLTNKYSATIELNINNQKDLLETLNILEEQIKLVINFEGKEGKALLNKIPLRLSVYREENNDGAMVRANFLGNTINYIEVNKSFGRLLTTMSHEFAHFKDVFIMEYILETQEEEISGNNGMSSLFFENMVNSLFSKENKLGVLEEIPQFKNYQDNMRRLQNILIFNNENIDYNDLVPDNNEYMLVRANILNKIVSIFTNTICSKFEKISDEDKKIFKNDLLLSLNNTHVPDEIILKMEKGKVNSLFESSDEYNIAPNTMFNNELIKIGSEKSQLMAEIVIFQAISAGVIKLNKVNQEKTNNEMYNMVLNFNSYIDTNAIEAIQKEVDKLIDIPSRPSFVISNNSKEKFESIAIKGDLFNNYILKEISIFEETHQSFYKQYLDLNIELFARNYQKCIYKNHLNNNELRSNMIKGFSSIHSINLNNLLENKLTVDDIFTENVQNYLSNCSNINQIKEMLNYSIPLDQLSDKLNRIQELNQQISKDTVYLLENKIQIRNILKNKNKSKKYCVL